MVGLHINAFSYLQNVWVWPSNKAHASACRPRIAAAAWWKGIHSSNGLFKLV